MDAYINNIKKKQMETKAKRRYKAGENRYYDEYLNNRIERSKILNNITSDLSNVLNTYEKLYSECLKIDRHIKNIKWTIDQKNGRLMHAGGIEKARVTDNIVDREISEMEARLDFFVMERDRLEVMKKDALADHKQRYGKDHPLLKMLKE